MPKIESKEEQLQKQTYPSLEDMEAAQRQQQQPSPQMGYQQAPGGASYQSLQPAPLPPGMPQFVPHQEQRYQSGILPPGRAELAPPAHQYEAMPSGLLFLLGFLCCPLWPVGAALYLRSRNHFAKGFAIASLVMTLLATYVLLKVFGLM